MLANLALALPAQSQSYRDQTIQRQNQQSDFVNRRLEYIAQPFRDAKRCYKFSIDSSHLSGIGYNARPPLLCVKNGGGVFLAEDGVPTGYYRGVSIRGSLHGDSGYRWVNESGHLTTTSVSIVNADMFILQYSNSYCSASGRFECYFSEGKCYSSQGYAGPFSEKSLRDIAERLDPRNYY
jgi:hypothetical protein